MQKCIEKWFNELIFCCRLQCLKNANVFSSIFILYYLSIYLNRFQHIWANKGPSKVRDISIKKFEINLHANLLWSYSAVWFTQITKSQYMKEGSLAIIIGLITVQSWEKLQFESRLKTTFRPTLITSNQHSLDGLITSN